MGTLKEPIFESQNAEVAVLNKDGDFITGNFINTDVDDVCGWMTTNQLVKLITDVSQI